MKRKSSKKKKREGGFGSVFTSIRQALYTTQTEKAEAEFKEAQTNSVKIEAALSDLAKQIQLDPKKFSEEAEGIALATKKLEKEISELRDQLKTKQSEQQGERQRLQNDINALQVRIAQSQSLTLGKGSGAKGEGEEDLLKISKDEREEFSGGMIRISEQLNQGRPKLEALRMALENVRTSSIVT